MALDRTAGTADDKLAELHNQITEGVAALTDSDAWRAMLDTAAKFHHYSLGNLLLITAQAPHATRVAGFHTWRSVGRQVRKGERGIAILAPCTFRPKVTDTATPDAVGGSTDDRSDRNDSAVTTDGNKDAKKTRRGQARRFRRAYVFDISQTDGDPLTDVRPELLTGQAPAGLWDSLTAQVQAHGYTVERGPCGTANGYTNPATHIVRVREDGDDAQAVKTLAHELGHIKCGHVEDMPTYLFCRGRCEIEAESVAYVVTSSAGMDPSGYTFAYVAKWADGDLDKVRASAGTVTTAARAILAALTPDQASAADDQPCAA